MSFKIYSQLLWVTALAVSAFSAHAQTTSESSTSLQEGEYVTQAGWGNLNVSKSDVRGSTPFIIDTLTGESNCHIEGVVNNGQAIVNNSESGDICKIKFTKTNQGIDVSPQTVEECRSFCGSNGGFNALFLTVPDRCQATAINKARDNFKIAYRNKNYKKSLATLTPILTECTAILDPIDLGNIRNDVAITQYKNNQRDACLKTLQPYASDAKQQDREIIEDWSANNHADDYLKIIHAARTNLKLCGK